MKKNIPQRRVKIFLITYKRSIQSEPFNLIRIVTNCTYLYNGIPASSLNQNTMYTLSLAAVPRSQGNCATMPSTA